jgi:3-deoxy-D-arabino-heptulosonate 7-phosphate (DAHP) synthase
VTLIFFKGSRYEKVAEYVARDSYGNRNIVKKIRVAPATKGIRSYEIKQNDRLDIMAYQYYRNPTKFWFVCDANKEMYPDELLKKGKRIRIAEETF